MGKENFHFDSSYFSFFFLQWFLEERENIYFVFYDDLYNTLVITRDPFSKIADTPVFLPPKKPKFSNYNFDQATCTKG